MSTNGSMKEEMVSKVIFNNLINNLIKSFFSESGWWQYDQRTSQELETAYKQGKRSCELLIAGFLYIADFGQMLQLRRNDHSRKRRIKRDLYNAPKKGVAGLRLNNQTSRESEEQQQQQAVREIRGAERPASPASDNMGIVVFSIFCFVD